MDLTSRAITGGVLELCNISNVHQWSVMHTFRCAVVVVQDCRQTIEESMVELAGSDVNAEDGGENEVKEKVKHCCYVAIMRQVVW